MKEEENLFKLSRARQPTMPRGRPPGSKNKKTLEAEAAVAHARPAQAQLLVSASQARERIVGQHAHGHGLGEELGLDAQR